MLGRCDGRVKTRGTGGTGSDLLPAVSTTFSWIRLCGLAPQEAVTPMPTEPVETRRLSPKPGPKPIQLVERSCHDGQT
jgi:hypothetical protein